MSELSIFLDESGDVGEYRHHSPYYIITMVFHDQDDDITQYIKALDSELDNLGFGNMAVHTEPLIRREEVYSRLWPNERRAIDMTPFSMMSKRRFTHGTCIEETK